jgi:hypothetical protein
MTFEGGRTEIDELLTHRTHQLTMITYSGDQPT